MAEPITLPEGFVLEPQDNSLPEGFVLDVSDTKQPSLINQGKRQLALTGRYALEGLAGLGDLPNLAINSIGGALGYKPNLQYPSQMVGSALTELGMPEPQGGFERVVGDASRSLIGTGGAMKAAQALTPYAPMLSALGENPTLQAKTALGASTAGGTTREMGGSPLAQLGAGIVGGGLASIGSLPKKEVYGANELRQQSNAAYQKANELGGAIKPEYAAKIFDDIEASLPQDRASKLLEGDSPARNILKDLKLLTSQPITLEEAQSIDKHIGNKITKFILPNGKPDADGKALMEIRDAFRESIENAGDDALIGGKEGFDAWKEAKSLWSKSLKLGDIEHILSRGEGRDNAATVIKNGFATLRDNRKRFATYNEEEKKAIKEAAKTGVMSEILRIPGSRLVPIAELATGSPLGSLSSMAGGIAARGGRDALQAKRAMKVAEAIAGKKPRDLTNPLLAISTGTIQGVNNRK